jgi:hypothetical protein
MTKKNITNLDSIIKSKFGEEEESSEEEITKGEESDTEEKKETKENSVKREEFSRSEINDIIINEEINEELNEDGLDFIDNLPSNNESTYIEEDNINKYETNEDEDTDYTISESTKLKGCWYYYEEIQKFVWKYIEQEKELHKKKEIFIGYVFQIIIYIIIFVSIISAIIETEDLIMEIYGVRAIIIFIGIFFFYFFTIFL